ncbi:MAG TPA: pyruvate dehydrogenase complex dihydrolipoamide acetyltransferase [Edaphocola sp.]|nr:pyruvate dehydrogenase complex dihydrolipoamide acetyltransferase [Edaphocola sp.]
MAEVVRMPLLSDTMKEGVIAAWHKKVGDKVKSDDVLAEVETDKATMEVMPYVDGTILYISDQKKIPVNGIMTIIGDEGEDITELLKEDSSEAPPQAESSKTAPTENVDTPKQSLSEPDSSLATVVQMPLLSDTMKEGKIASWLKNIGDKVASDDVIAEVETDKATMEVMPYADGVLLYQAVPAGGAVPVNDILAIVGKAGTDVQPYIDYFNQKNNTNSAESSSSSEQEKKEEASKAEKQSNNTESVSVDSDANGRIKISPLARKMAKEKGINISQLKGTGEGGRIIKVDIENYVPSAAAATPLAANHSISGQESHTDIELSQMRQVIAQRLGESKFSAPHFYLTISVKMDKAIEARTEMNKISESKISFNDLVIKASAMALQKHPQVNSSWMGSFIRENHHIHIGMAVAIPEGLIVPVIKFANQMPLSMIAAQAKELGQKAKDKKLQPVEFTGNTFTISNLGMMDIDEFTGIINPPDACILAVGKIEPTPVVENNEIVIRSIMKLTLSCDHRVVDGAVGSSFLQTLKSYLENPVNMLV